LTFSILNIEVHGPLDSCGPRSGALAAPPLVGPEQECNFNFVRNGWARLATRCGWA